MNTGVRLSTTGLQLRVGEKLLVRDLSVEFSGGQNWAILGANGSGKTTLLHTLAGLHHATGGGIHLDGAPLAACPRRERARRLGLLLQDSPSAFPAAVIDIVLSGRHPHLGRWQQESEEDFRLAGAALAESGLAGYERRNQATLSGGERRRVEIAALLAQDAPINLLDEPVNHLDPRYQHQLLGDICRRVERPGHLNLIVLHDINLAVRFCSHALLLLPGGDTVHGPLDTILDPGTLERLYGCPMRTVGEGRGRLYAPA